VIQNTGAQIQFETVSFDCVSSVPHWENEAAELDKKWEDESVTVPCFVNLSDELSKLSYAESETEVTQPVGKPATKRSKSSHKGKHQVRKKQLHRET